MNETNKKIITLFITPLIKLIGLKLKRCGYNRNIKKLDCDTNQIFFSAQITTIFLNTICKPSMINSKGIKNDCL